MTIRFTDEDLIDHDAVAAVIRDSQGRVLILDHVKFNLPTIPIGKAHTDQAPVDALKEEMKEELNIVVQECQEVANSLIEYDEDRNVLLRFHIFNVLKYSGELRNLEPAKHRGFEFKSIDEIARLPALTDATILFLASEHRQAMARWSGRVRGRVQLVQDSEDH